MGRGRIRKGKENGFKFKFDADGKQPGALGIRRLGSVHTDTMYFVPHQSEKPRRGLGVYAYGDLCF